MGGLGGVRFPNFPIVSPKIPKNWIFHLSFQKLVQKSFGEESVFSKKNLLHLVLHFLFYKFFCISYPKSVAFKNLIFTQLTATIPISLRSQKFQNHITFAFFTHVVSKFHLNPSTHPPVAPFQKKLSFFSLCLVLIIFRIVTLFKFT